MQYTNARLSSERNYSNEQLEEIGKSDGVIGIFFSRKFLTRDSEGTIQAICDHINYIRKQIGLRHVAIGSDFGGIVNGVPADFLSVSMMQKLFEALHRDGWKEEEIEKIAFKNAERILQSHLTK